MALLDDYFYIYCHISFTGYSTFNNKYNLIINKYLINSTLIAANLCLSLCQWVSLVLLELYHTSQHQNQIFCILGAILTTKQSLVQCTAPQIVPIWETSWHNFCIIWQHVYIIYLICKISTWLIIIRSLALFTRSEIQKQNIERM